MQEEKWSLHQAAEALSRLQSGLQDMPFALQAFLKARVQKIGSQGWLVLNADEGVEEALRTDSIEDLKQKIEGELVRFVDDAWVEGRISVTHISDEADLDEKIYDPIFREDLPPFDGSEYVTNNLHLKASRFTTKTEGHDFVAYGSAGSNLYIRKKFFPFNEKENMVVTPTAPIVSIGDECAFVRFNGFYFIFNEKRFEQLSGHSSMVLKRAEAAINALIEIEGVSFANLDVVFEALSNTEFARKLAAAHSQGVFSDLSAETLKDDIAANDIKLEFEHKDGNLVLNPDLSTRDKRREFVDLLVESLFVSRSGRKWRALQKEPRR